MKADYIHKIVKILAKETPKWDVPIVTLVAESSKDPFKVLISTVLSLRTKDETTAVASRRLFKLADNPADMLKLSEKQIIEAIYPVGFYKTKAKNIHEICKGLITKYDFIVPDDIDELLKFKGVGRKTANLVVTLGYGKPGICVDTHVHRISNRFGYIKTKTPDETETALRKKLPKEYWIDYNNLLVSFGQHLCRPISPKCSICPVIKFCDRVGVTTSR
ncbi:MAG: endonuclease III [Thermodesulfobacteriales bacterium]|nr:MAG: endonuclease III [Thermodesulfobacteriales bacterium]